MNATERGCRFPNGDYVGSNYDCRYSGCQSRNAIQLAVRSASTADSDGVRQLLYYNLTTSSTGYSKVRDISALYADYGTYDATLRPWFNQGRAAPVVAFGPNGTCWGSPKFTTVYVWIAPLLSVVQAVYSNCGAGTKGDLVAVIAVDFDFDFLSEQLKLASPNPECESTIVQQYGEVIAADDHRVTQPSSGGGSRRLIATSSALDLVKEMALDIWNEYGVTGKGGYPPAQNQTLTKGSFLLLSSSIAAWETYYDFIPTEFSTWSALRAYPRAIFYSQLDKGMVRSTQPAILKEVTFFSCRKFRLLWWFSLSPL